MIDLLVCLHRHEITAHKAFRQMSPGERIALQTHIELVRGAIPRFVLNHYEQLKSRCLMLHESPTLLAMATLVSAYQALPPRKRHSLNSFFALAGYSMRTNGKRPLSSSR
ncbi:MAG TPA: hypothetical protein VEC99_03090 [Clostridia bacterium]|nr:hypothetical protein [Clostridia bacterium]